MGGKVIFLFSGSLHVFDCNERVSEICHRQLHPLVTPLMRLAGALDAVGDSGAPSAPGLMNDPSVSVVRTPSVVVNRKLSSVRPSVI